jgi:hypothetical protein
MLAAFAQFDNDVRSERTLAGMKAAILEGKWTFKAPIGYRNVPGTLDGLSITLDPSRAPLVKMAFEEYASGIYTKQQVLQRVTVLGLRDASNDKLSAQTFDKLLRNPIYAGWLTVPKWGLREKATFEPLVSEQTFQNVQDILLSRRTPIASHVRNHPDFPPRVFVKCLLCGNGLTGSWSKGRSKRYPYYFCRTKNCRAVKIRKESLEKQFVSLLESLRPRTEFISLFKEIVLDVWKQKQGDEKRQMVAFDEKGKQLRDRKNRLVDALLYHRIDQPTYDEQLDKIHEDFALVEIGKH